MKKNVAVLSSFVAGLIGLWFLLYYDVPFEGSISSAPAITIGILTSVAFVTGGYLLDEKSASPAIGFAILLGLFCLLLSLIGVNDAWGDVGYFVWYLVASAPFVLIGLAIAAKRFLLGTKRALIGLLAFVIGVVINLLVQMNRISIS